MLVLYISGAVGELPTGVLQHGLEVLGYGSEACLGGQTILDQLIGAAVPEPGGAEQQAVGEPAALQAEIQLLRNAPAIIGIVQVLGNIPDAAAIDIPGALGLPVRDILVITDIIISAGAIASPQFTVTENRQGCFKPFFLRKDPAGADCTELTPLPAGYEPAGAIDPSCRIDDILVIID